MCAEASVSTALLRLPSAQRSTLSFSFQLFALPLLTGWYPQNAHRSPAFTCLVPAECTPSPETSCPVGDLSFQQKSGTCLKISRGHPDVHFLNANALDLLMQGRMRALGREASGGHVPILLLISWINSQFQKLKGLGTVSSSVGRRAWCWLPSQVSASRQPQAAARDDHACLWLV